MRQQKQKLRRAAGKRNHQEGIMLQGMLVDYTTFPN